MPPKKAAKVAKLSQAKASTSTIVTRSRKPVKPESDPESDQFEYSDEGGDVEQSMEDEGDVKMTTKKTEYIIIESSDDDEVELIEPPEEVAPVRKGKLSGRRLLQQDISVLVEKYGHSEGTQIINFKKGDDENIEFSLVTPSFKRGLKLVVMIPESSEYPISHQIICYAESEITREIENILGEISEMPQSSGRSLNGIISYLVSRIILKEPPTFSKPSAPAFKESQREEEDDEDDEHGYEEWNDDIFGIGGGAQQSLAMKAALRSDFKSVMAAGYRPGYSRISELENVVSVSCKVNSLNVDLRTLQAWDSDLITGEVVYLVLLLFFGSKYPVDADNGSRSVRFAIGISPKPKPSKEAIHSASRSTVPSGIWTKNEFDSISLSKPLESLMNEKFAEILLIRRKYSSSAIGWDSATHHVLEHGSRAELDLKAAKVMDEEQTLNSAAYRLPVDPLLKKSTQNNYPLVAFTFLLRRFIMCPAFCLVCYKKVNTSFSALKPYVCANQLCLFQHEKLNLSAALEHEIKTNAAGVDLLIQLCFTSAKESALKVLPDGLELQVPASAIWKLGDPTKDFDSLSEDLKFNGLVALINELPRVSAMKDWLLGEHLTALEAESAKTRTLENFKGSSVPLSAWKVLRWIASSNTSYLRLVDNDEKIQGIKSSYRQFRLLVGSPAKEADFTVESEKAASTNPNSASYGNLWAFHGSAVKNWHSILREGLHFKTTVNGRAYGHGIYLASNGDVSLGTYATVTTSQWKNADFPIGKLAAVCEIVNLPSQFVSSNPYLVVDKVEWVQCRYLIVQKGSSLHSDVNVAQDDSLTNSVSRCLKMDPAYPLTISNKRVTIPDVEVKLESLAKRLLNSEEELNDSDKELMKEPSMIIPKFQSAASIEKHKFEPISKEILAMIPKLPAPTRSNPGTAINIQREVKAMMKIQQAEGTNKCGFYFDPERSGDNIFSWVIEMVNFDKDLPLAKDMKKHGISSLLFEIRFPQNFPLAPPFIRLAYPRLLPFAAGGGGSVTVGGSICMDLLTATGWSAVYSMDSVLLQIRMAISATEDRVARLDTNWKQPYSMHEAVEAFSRSASTHGWTVDPSFTALARGGAF